MAVVTLVLVIPVALLFVNQMLMDHGLFMVLRHGVLDVQNQKHLEFMPEFHFMPIG